MVKVYIEGTQRVSIRNKIFREVCANLLIHKEFSSAYPAKLIIENDRFSDSDLLLSWKGYNFDVLNKLDDEDYIRQGTRPSRSKSVYITQAITQAGIDKAKELMKKYGIEE